MATRVFAAYTAFLAKVQAAVPSTVTVYDGPQAQLPNALDYVIVGCADPMSTGMLVAVDSGQQDWAAVASSLPKDERFRIHSTVVAWTGAADWPDCRTRVDTTISAIETAVRNDASLGGALGNGPAWASLAVLDMGHVNYSEGMALHVQIALDCRARI